MQDAFGVERGLVSKKEKEASAGRLALGTIFGPWHGAVAGKKGHKLRAAGNQLAGGVGGSLVGGTAGAALGAITRKPGAVIAGQQTGASAGSYAGSFMGTKRAQRMGHFKPER